jgi:mRNA interferase MazF
VISDDRLNAGPGGVVVVLPMTTRHRGLPMHVEIDAGAGGLEHDSYVRCEDVRSVSEQRLVSKLGSAPVDAMFKSAQILRWLLALD